METTDCIYFYSEVILNEVRPFLKSAFEWHLHNNYVHRNCYLDMYTYINLAKLLAVCWVDFRDH